jgi:molybdenum cofactor biosynthesis protein B
MTEHKSSSSKHRKEAKERGPILVALLTISDSRTSETDVNGRYLREQIEAMGHRVIDSRIVKDDSDQIRIVVDMFSETEAQIILTNGGTGITRRDTTIDVVESMLDKSLPGFGEIFRMLSYEQVGAAAMLSRAVGGVYRGKVILCTPGSPAAVELAWTKLIAPEIEHLAWELVR